MEASLQAAMRRALARLRGFLRPGDADDDFREELRAHLDMAVEDKVRRGLSPREARRQAHLELGNVTQLRDAASDARGLPWLSGSWLDVKLGLRMLRRSWGLTLVAGLAMTVVITLAALAFELLGLISGTELPLDEGERVVVVQAWDRESGDGVGTSRDDFERWRETLRTVEGLGAFRHAERNLQTSARGDQAGETVEVAEMTSSGFGVARVAPALGRPLLPEDEAADAAPVVVIGHLAWRDRFQADPGVLGRRVRLDGRVHTVVGVMPEGFGFPVADHYWVPLRPGLEGQAAAAGGDGLLVFARLRDGVSLRRADAELHRVGRLPDDGPEVAAGREAAGLEAGLPPGLRVVPYAEAFLSDLDSWVLDAAVLVFLLLLVPPCLNVAILVYARTLSRQGEFAARHVLGASRRRIVFQLFVEILVLAGCAGALALVVARAVVGHLVAGRQARGELPFWMDLGLSPRTLAVVALMAVFAALVAGVVPALRATGRGMALGLRSLGAQTQRAQLGTVWTLLVVLQVAVSTALLPTAAEMVWGTVRSATLGPGFAAERYLTAYLEPGDGGAFTGASAGAFADRQREVARALEEDPGIAAVTVASHVPGEEPWLRLVVEGGAAKAAARGDEENAGLVLGSSRITQVNQVDESFLRVFQVPLLAGRALDGADFDPRRRTVLVNRAFAHQVLGDTNPVGRRIRYRPRKGEAPAVAAGPVAGFGADGSEGDWFEIVGVVENVHRHSANQAVYHPARGEPRPAVALVLGLRSDASGAAGVLRSTTWSVDPSLRLAEVRTLAEIYRQRALGNWVGAGAVVAATLSLLLLSAAGIYALLSFTVGRRRKEIGIRAALGASPGRLVAAIFRRALGQVAVGAFLGVWIAFLVDLYVPVDQLGGWEIPGVLPAAVGFIAAVAMLALVGPARRGLRLQPVEELRQG